MPTLSTLQGSESPINRIKTSSVLCYIDLKHQVRYIYIFMYSFTVNKYVKFLIKILRYMLITSNVYGHPANVSSMQCVSLQDSLCWLVDVLPILEASHLHVSSRPLVSGWGRGFRACQLADWCSTLVERGRNPPRLCPRPLF